MPSRNFHSLEICPGLGRRIKRNYKDFIRWHNFRWGETYVWGSRGSGRRRGVIGFWTVWQTKSQNWTSGLVAYCGCPASIVCFSIRPDWIWDLGWTLGYTPPWLILGVALSWLIPLNLLAWPARTLPVQISWAFHVAAPTGPISALIQALVTPEKIGLIYFNWKWHNWCRLIRFEILHEEEVVFMKDHNTGYEYFFLSRPSIFHPFWGIGISCKNALPNPLKKLIFILTFESNEE